MARDVFAVHVQHAESAAYASWRTSHKQGELSKSKGAADHLFDERVGRCVEINQCVRCTRQFFTKSFLSDGVAALVPSSGEESASPCHRAGVASMAWRTTM